MIYYKSRYLSKKLNIHLLKWKRWAREFLPPDPLGGLQSGYARQFTLKEVFRVYLGGYLVSYLKFSIPEARIVLADLTPWLKQRGFCRLQLPATIKAQLHAKDQVDYFRIYICPTEPGRFCYSIRGVTPIPETARSHYLHTFMEHATITLIKTDHDPIATGQTTSARMLCITKLYQDFIGKLL